MTIDKIVIQMSPRCLFKTGCWGLMNTVDNDYTPFESKNN